LYKISKRVLKMRKKLLGIIVISTGLLVGCANQPGQQGFTKEQVGTLGGAVAGGILGSQIDGGSTAATIGGTLLGGYLGQQVGSSLDKADRLAMERRAYHAVQRGQTQSWRSHNGDYHMRAQPRTTYTYQGHRCRNYTMTIQNDHGQLIRKVQGTACYKGNGDWYVTDREVVVP
jgi:surface antigen